MIVTGGFNVYPWELEDILAEHRLCHRSLLLAYRMRPESNLTSNDSWLTRRFQALECLRTNFLCFGFFIARHGKI